MTTTKYSYIRLEPADNGGAILTYDERVPDGKGPYDGCSSVSRKEVYTKENIGEAVTKMCAMVNITVEIKHEEESEEGEKTIKIKVGK